MSNLYEVLENCLQEMEKGADLETILFRYPEHADELRPILETSVLARELAAPDPEADVMRRGRAKVLGQAAQMRESQARPASRLWTVPLRRALVSLAVIGVLFAGSTGLVRAASTTLPGDNLYPVKRTWEDVRVLLTLDTRAREALEVEHENERLEELNELFAEGRSAEVDFAGIVESQNGDTWLVANVPVRITAQTDMRAYPVVTGDAVRVRGITQPDGTVLAERVDMLNQGHPLPDLDDDDPPVIEQESPEAENEAGEENSNQGPEDESNERDGNESPEPESGSEESSREGTVDSINGNILIVNGQPMNISGAEIKGTPRLGADVKVEGYFNAAGVFIVTKIEFLDGDSGSENSSDDHRSDDNDGGGEGDNGNADDNENSDSSDDNNDDPSNDNDENKQEDNGGNENNDNDNSGED